MQSNIMVSMFITGASLPSDNMMAAFAKQRLDAGFQHMEDRLKSHKWLAGDNFTAADVMSLYWVTTQRYFGPLVRYRSSHIIIIFQLED